MSVPQIPVLDSYLNFRNGRTTPKRDDLGAYAVFGSNGLIGHSHETNVEGPLVVIGRVGSYCGSLHFSREDAWVTDNAIVCTSKSGGDARYWYFALGSLDLNGRSSGSGQPLLNQRVLGSIQFTPPGADQRLAIAEVLGALDDKILVNSKLIEAADGLASTIFRSIAADSTRLPLSSVARFVNGKAFTKGASGTGRVVIRIAELNSGLGGSTVYSDAAVAEDFVARPGDILFAWSGSLTLHRWFRTEGIVNQHIFKVIPNAGPSWLVYELIRDRLPYFKGIAADKATTMGHIQRHHLDEPVTIPSKSAIERVDELMSSIWERTLVAERENESLAATRDALLPQLMSGKLRVRDAEKVLEGVL